MLSSRVSSLMMKTRQASSVMLEPTTNTLRSLSSAVKGGGGNKNSGGGGGSGGNKKKSLFTSPRPPSKTYLSRYQPKPLKRAPIVKGPREPFDISRPIPKIDFSNIPITEKLSALNNDDEDDEDDPTGEDDFSDFGPILTAALKKAKHDGGQDLDAETYLKMMDYFAAPPGSTEDLVGERRILSLESWDGTDRQAIQDEIDRLIHQERLDYLELPPSDYVPDPAEIELANRGGNTRVPPNQLAHGPWGELLVRTDRVVKMWRGGRIESYRALVIGGNLRGCGGFGIGKAFEPEDAVEIASRMARRNIFFVDRYRNKSLTRDLVGRQNSCKVYLRTSDNGLRGNPLACEILKLMGITNAVCKAHGSRSHLNVVRATFKALLTHESLDEIALKRGVRLVNLEKAKHLGV